MPDLSGRTLGKYQIIERLGKGGMAEVYKAYQPGLERYVAIKVLLPHLADSDDFIGRFRREAKAVSNLHHANIVQVFDFDLDDANNYYYMVMEFIDGATLKDRLAGLSRAGKTMSIAETINFFEGLLAGVGYAHAQGMVHRDLKPANAMFDRAGRPVLTDFGIAKIVGAARYTVTGAVVGTLAYMSPEQAQGAPGDERSDIYALGIVLYEALTGQLPYDADTPLAVMLKHISEPVPVLRQFSSDFPEALEKVVLCALAKNRDDRYRSAADMWEALRAIRDQETGIGHASVIPATSEKSRAPALADQSTPPALAARSRTQVAPLAAELDRRAVGEARPVALKPRLQVPRYVWFASLAVIVALVGGLLYFNANFSTGAVAAMTAQAQVQVQTGDYQLALKTFNEILDRQPNYVPAILGRAKAYVGLGQPDVALKEVERAVTLAPNDPGARVARGRYTLLYTSGPDVAAVMKDFDKAIELDPASGEAYLARGWAILKFENNAAGALNDLRAAVRLNPSDAEAHRTLANALYATKDYETSVAEYEQAIRLKADDPDYYVESAIARYALADLFNGIRDLDGAINLKPQQAEHYAMRAFLYYERTKYGEASADVDKSLQLNPGNPAALYVRALTNYQLADYDLAMKDFDAVSKHPPYEYNWPFLSLENIHEINLDRAITLQEMAGREAEARAAYDACVAANPDWFAAYYYRGYYLANHGEPQAARPDLERALELAPDEDWRNLALKQLQAIK